MSSRACLVGGRLPPEFEPQTRVPVDGHPPFLVTRLFFSHGMVNFPRPDSVPAMRMTLYHHLVSPKAIKASRAAPLWGSVHFSGCKKNTDLLAHLARIGKTAVIRGLSFFLEGSPFSWFQMETKRTPEPWFQYVRDSLKG